MSFVYPEKKGVTYAPGYFLANNEDCVRLTQKIAQNSALVQTVGTAKYVPMGTPYPENNGTAIGIVYEDVDVTSGNMPGSVVMSGTVYENRLPVTLASAAKTALQGKGFVFVTEGNVTRPYIDSVEVESGGAD